MISKKSRLSSIFPPTHFNQFSFHFWKIQYIAPPLWMLKLLEKMFENSKKIAINANNLFFKKNTQRQCNESLLLKYRSTKEKMKSGNTCWMMPRVFQSIICFAQFLSQIVHKKNRLSYIIYSIETLHGNLYFSEQAWISLKAIVFKYKNCALKFHTVRVKKKNNFVCVNCPNLQTHNLFCCCLTFIVFFLSIV